MKLILIFFSLTAVMSAKDFTSEVKQFLSTYCLDCHGGKKVKGKVDLKEALTHSDPIDDYELWKEVLTVIKEGKMPPEDENQPKNKDVKVFENWHENVFTEPEEVISIYAGPRRLSKAEIKNSLKTLFGFNLNEHGEVDVKEDESISKRRRKVNPYSKSRFQFIDRILPPDPPGNSGYTNDTSNNPVTKSFIESYTLLTDSYIKVFLSENGSQYRESYISGKLTEKNASELLKKFAIQAMRGGADKAVLSDLMKGFESHLQQGVDLEANLKSSLKKVLFSPRFLFTDIFSIKSLGRYDLNSIEVAQRLSFFIWGCGPDDKLLQAAISGKLIDQNFLKSELSRMLKDPKSIYLSKTMATEWFSLASLKDNQYDLPLYDGVVQFFNYLIQENLPLMDLVDSNVVFANSKTYSKVYALRESKAQKKAKAQNPENKKKKTKFSPTVTKFTLPGNSRGGMMTQAGILKMTSTEKATSPILRGVWLLEKILGHELRDPPMDVPPLPTGNAVKKLSFREIFNRHRQEKRCAVCHDKIDPLGFALEGFNQFGAVKKSKEVYGELPGGLKFNGFVQFKEILKTNFKDDIYQNIVRQILSFALTRKLTFSDQVAVKEITAQLDDKSGFRDLLSLVATHPLFTQTHIK